MTAITMSLSTAKSSSYAAHPLAVMVAEVATPSTFSLMNISRHSFASTGKYQRPRNGHMAARACR